MRFIHTADWHLGRLFHGVHLTDDQRHVLLGPGGFVDLVRDARPDLVIVAGDIYDRAVPPPDAVQLLDDVLSRLVLDLAVPVVLIAGNHDSPGRLSFGSRLLAGRRLYVTGCVSGDCPPLVLSDAFGPVEFYSIPYAEPATVRQCLGCEHPLDHNGAMRMLTDRIRARLEDGSADSRASRRVAIAHAFVAGGAESESERPLSVGGAGTVDAAHFAAFHYTALGHLHCPQSIGDERNHVRYAGSLLRYSFDEVGSAGNKSVYVVEMDAAGQCRCEPVALTPRRDVRRIEGRLTDLLQNPPADGTSRDDYLEVILLDDGPVLDAMGKLREVYPNVLHLRRPEPKAVAGDDGATADRPADVRRLSEVELFRRFFRHASGDDLTAEQEAAFVSVVEEMQRKQREADVPPPAETTSEPVAAGEPPPPAKRKRRGTEAAVEASPSS